MKSLHEYIIEQVDESKIYITDSERVDSAEDYESLLTELLGKINLNLSDFESYEGETRLLKFKIESYNFSVFVEGNTDYVDSIPILNEINRWFESEGKNVKIYSYWSSNFGQEIGFFYSENSKVIEALLNLIDESQNSEESIGNLDEIEAVLNKINPKEAIDNSANKEKLFTLKENYKSNSNGKAFQLLLGFILILFGIFAESFIPIVPINLFTGILFGCFIGIGIYKIHKYI